MRKTLKSLFGMATAAALLAVGNGTTFAGELVDTSLEGFLAADFTTAPSQNITNPWWTLTAGGNRLYFTENDGECEWNLVEVLPLVTDQFFGQYAGTDARIVLDRAWLDEECEYDDFADVWANLDAEESTYDWFAQDADQNIWYLGEDTFNGEDHHGSFTAGCDGAEAGIVVLGKPEKGEFYKQEFYEDEAEDWGKVLNFVAMDDFVCMKTKEWSPLEPGHIEHKFYCHDDPAGPGELLLIKELQGKTVVVEPVDWDVPSPGDPTELISMTPQCPPYAPEPD